MKNARRRFATFLGVFVLMSAIAYTQTLQLEESVAVSGGGTSAGGSLTMLITIGQPFAGGFLNSERHRAYIGFWTPQLSPTAANVAVSGRVRTKAGQGLANITITLANANGDIWIARTGSFGYYRFEQIPTGNTYMLTAFSKRYTFSNSPGVISVGDEVSDLDIVAIDP